MLLMDAHDSSQAMEPAVSSEASVKAHADRLTEHRALLIGIARRLTKSAADADDLVQDTIERALKKGASIPSDKLRSWLVTILNNLFIDQCRQRARRPQAGADVIASLPTPEPDESKTWHALDGAALKRAVDELPDDFARVYRMHAFEKKSYAEISAALDVPNATVGTRLLRARQRLKKILMANLAKFKDSGEQT